MTVSCSICTNVLKNNNSLRTHMSKYHPQRKSVDEAGKCREKEELILPVIEPVNCPQKDEIQNQTGKEMASNIYSSTCPSRMNVESQKASGAPDDGRYYIPKRKSRKLKNNVRENPFPRQRFQKSKTKISPIIRTCFPENSDVTDRLTSLKIDWKRFTAKSSQPLFNFNLLTSYGVRNLMIKKMGSNSALLVKLTEKQGLLVEAVLSLQSLCEVGKLLNENVDMVLEIITEINGRFESYVSLLNDTYNKISVLINTGFDCKLLKLTCFPKAGDISSIPLTSKVKLEVTRNGQFWRLITIAPSNFQDCTKCRAPLSNAYEALNCKGCLNPEHELAKGTASIVDIELKDYTYGNGLKNTLSLDEITYFTVIFSNGFYYKLID